jgi:hypothetical protein
MLKQLYLSFSFIFLSFILLGQAPGIKTSTPDTLERYTDSKWTLTYYDNVYSHPYYHTKNADVPLGYIKEVGDDPIILVLNSSLELNYRWNKHLGVSCGFKYSMRQPKFLTDYLLNDSDIHTALESGRQHVYGIPLFLTSSFNLNRKFQVFLSLGAISSYLNTHLHSSTDNIEYASVKRYELRAYFRPELRINIKHAFIGFYGTTSAQIFGASDLEYINYRRYTVGGGFSVGYFLYQKKNTVFRPDFEDK